MHQKKLICGFVLLASSIGLAGLSWGVTPINSLNDGRIIQGDTYYNTSNAKTTFVNSGSGGLWLQSGTTVRGLEVNSSGNLTNNGGTIQLYAPGNVVRVDGNLDVSGLVNGKGAYIGDGGKVFVDAGYLYQNGNILANGQNGGLVQVNVGAATLTNGALIEAKGLNGSGGVVNINSSGPVDLQTGSTINTSGWTVGAFDRNVINIEGGMVNSVGVLRADGISSSGQGVRGGTIRLITSGIINQPQPTTTNDVLTAATFNNPNDTSTPTLSQAERNTLADRNNFLSEFYYGDINIGQENRTNSVALISANGSGNIPSNANDPYGGHTRAGDGGTIIMSSQRNIDHFYGMVQANGANGGSRLVPYAGGDGGTISLNAQNLLTTSADAVIKANAGAGGSILSSAGTGANGGDGGLITISTNDVLQIPGSIQANGAVGGRGSIPGQGGQGGLIMISGGPNTQINGLIIANGAFGGNSSTAAGGKPGTITGSFPINPDNVKQLGFINGQFVNKPLTESTQEHELVTHGENLISLVFNSLNPVNENFLKDTLPNSNIRSVTDPTGLQGVARQEVISKNTSTAPYVYRNLVVSNNGGMTNLNFAPLDANSMKVLSGDRAFKTLNTFSARSSGLISNDPESTQPSNFWIVGNDHNIFGGGHIALATDIGYSMTNDDTLQTKGTANSGSILLSSGNLQIGTALPTLIDASSGLHGGAIQIKVNNGISISGTDKATKLSTDGRLMGGYINMYTHGVYNSQLKTSLSADATGTSEKSQAGIITVRGFEGLSNGADIGVDGLVSSIHANSNNGRGGYVQLGTSEALVNNIGMIESNGGSHGGIVSLTGGGFITGIVPSLPKIRIGSLTPPKTNITGTLGSDFIGDATVINLGAINALGRGGRIYMGSYDGVVFAQKDHSLYPNSPLPSLNGQPVLPSIILNSSNPDTLLQTIGQNINKNGQQVYVLVGALTNTAGETRNAVDIVNAEAAPNHSAPNVNPNQDGQGAAFTQDFQIQPMP